MSRPATSRSVPKAGRQGIVRHGSARAVNIRTSADSPFDRARKALFEEGISSSRMYLTRRALGREPIDEIVSGVRSAFTYAGAADVEQFTELAQVGIQSGGGIRRRAAFAPPGRGRQNVSNRCIQNRGAARLPRCNPNQQEETSWESSCSITAGTAVAATAALGFGVVAAAPATAKAGNDPLAGVLVDGNKFDKNKKDYDILTEAVLAVLAEKPTVPSRC